MRSILNSHFYGYLTNCVKFRPLFNEIYYYYFMFRIKNKFPLIKNNIILKEIKKIYLITYEFK